MNLSEVKIFESYSNFENHFKELIKDEKIDQVHNIGLKNLMFFQKYFKELPEQGMERVFLALDFLNNNNTEILTKLWKNGGKKIKDSHTTSCIIKYVNFKEESDYKVKSINDRKILLKFTGELFRDGKVFETVEFSFSEQDLFLKNLVERLAVMDKYEKAQKIVPLITHKFLKKYAEKVIFDEKKIKNIN
jgi:hypothetical protein